MTDSDVFSWLKKSLRFSSRAGLGIVERFAEANLRHAIKCWIRTLDSSNSLHQPIPGAGISSGIRITSGQGAGSPAVLKSIAPHLSGNTVLDIGSNSGFFSYELAKAGFSVTGLEPDNQLVKVAAALQVLHPTLDFVTRPKPFPGAEGLADKYDNVLCLSVFQQWSEFQGFEEAKKSLSVAVSHCRENMFFSMPNTLMNKKIAVWVPDMGKTATACRDWVAGLLSNASGGGEVKWLGLLDSDFRPMDRRDLFLLKVKNGPS